MIIPDFDRIKPLEPLEGWLKCFKSYFANNDTLELTDLDFIELISLLEELKERREREADGRETAENNK